MQKKTTVIFLIIFLAILIIAFIFIPRKKIETSSEQKIEIVEDENKKEEKCGVVSCHGMEISCGENLPKVCEGEYQIGDACKRFASCVNQDGQCKLLESKNFEKCKTCVESCKAKFALGTLEIIECEGECHKKINETDTAVLD